MGSSNSKFGVTRTPSQLAPFLQACLYPIHFPITTKRNLVKMQSDHVSEATVWSTGGPQEGLLLHSLHAMTLSEFLSSIKIGE